MMFQVIFKFWYAHSNKPNHGLKLQYMDDFLISMRKAIKFWMSYAEAKNNSGGARETYDLSI